MTANSPETAKPPATSDTDVIEIVDFEPVSSTSGKSEAPSSRSLKIRILVFLALPMALFLLYLFNVNVITLKINVADARSEIDGVLNISLSDRLLLLPGQPVLRVAAPGYQPWQQTIDVNELDASLLSVELQPLPGSLTVITAGQGRVFVDGIFAGETGQVIESIKAGKHKLTVEAERYLPTTIEVNITGRQVHQQLEVTLAPDWANVSLNSTPSPAAVLVDGEDRGQTPLELELDSGKHVITVQKNGFRHWQQILRVRAGEQLDLGNIELQAAASLSSINSKPSGANVVVDGQFMGKTPLRVPLEPGMDHQATLLKDGYQPLQVSLNPSQESFSFTLQPQLGDISIRATPSDALLYVDGILMGRANQTLTLPSRNHQLTVSRSGYASQTQTVTPRPGLDQIIAVSLLTEEEHQWRSIKPSVQTKADQTLLLFKPDDRFTMGASRREQGRRANESLHPVALTRPFYMAEQLVTNEQYRRFEAFHSSGHVKGNSLNGDQQPAVNISWLQAARYCNWLSEQEDLQPVYEIADGSLLSINHDSSGYRLPTEAEWAWAARLKGSQMLRFSWGDQLPPAAGSGNFGDRSAAALLGNILTNYDDGFPVTSPSGKFPPNHRGLRDMAGNAAEWIQDYYGITTGLNLDAEVNPVGPQKGDYHVIRGSSWAHATMTDLRLAYRDYGIERRNDVGFRLVRTVQVKAP